MLVQRCPIESKLWQHMRELFVQNRLAKSLIIAKPLRRYDRNDYVCRTIYRYIFCVYPVYNIQMTYSDDET